MKSIITFKQFNKALSELVRYIEFDDDICAVFNRYSRDSDFPTEYPYPSALLTTIVNLLEIATDDVENGWISYWLWELNCGKDYKDGCVIKKNNNVPLKTIEDLWNLLRSEQEALL